MLRLGMGPVPKILGELFAKSHLRQPKIRGLEEFWLKSHTQNYHTASMKAGKDDGGGGSLPLQGDDS